MERELLITGVGGQGVQLAAQVVARAATIEGRAVMLFGIYGGMMRGGNTDSTVVVADGPITAPPVVSQAWSAIAMHDEFWAPVEARLRPGGVVLVNDSTFGHVIAASVTVHRLTATEMAMEAGNAQAASMVMVGAYAALTGLVGIDALLGGMREAIPPYRRQHIETNEAAIRAGWGAVPRLAHPAWPSSGVPAHAEARL
jgi:Pyruvate/2-oxoacid:ferredoxin oxidoreductase gamma subunit